ncbi:hypothetical protein DMW15_22940 [Vibrio parahaemolyticus]|nr:hypothetical protein [Vibrio parahaemolyticus]
MTKHIDRNSKETEFNPFNKEVKHHEVVSAKSGSGLSILQAKVEREKAYRLKTAAFQEWQHKLHRNDTLPRGPFFKGKKAGKPIFIMDECHLLFERSTPDSPMMQKLEEGL